MIGHTVFQKFLLHNIFHKDSEAQLSNIIQNKKKFYFLHWIANSYKTILQSQYLPWNKYWYALKPKTILLKNAYVDEGFRVFNHKQYLLPQSLFRFEHAQNGPPPLLQNQNTVQYRLRKILLKILYPKDYAQYKNFRLHIPALKQHYKQFSYEIFHNKNTQYQYHNTYIYYTFLNYFWGSFGYFICDMLPSFIHFWQSLSKVQQKYIRILLPHQTMLEPFSNNIMQEILTLCGVQPSQISFIKHGILNQYKYLYHSNQTKLNPKLIQESTYYLQKQCYNSNMQKKFQSYKRIFIARKSHYSGRHIKNYKIVNKILHKYHITTVYLEDYSFKERMNLLYNVKFLISTVSAAAINVYLISHPIKMLFIAIYPHWPPWDTYLATILPIVHKKSVYLAEYHKYTEPYITIDIKKFENTIIKLLNCSL